MSDRSKHVKNCVARFRAVVKPEWGVAPWNALAECIEIAVKSGVETAHHQLEALVEALEIRAREESDGEFIATFDRPTVLAMLDEIERLRREVREWMCDGCNTVYPGPPQPGIWCVQCPRCGGDTTPRGVIERRRLEREVERLRREKEALVEALMPASEALADLDKGYYRVAKQDPGGYVMGSVSVVSLVTVIESTRKALALLDGEKGGDRRE